MNTMTDQALAQLPEGLTDALDHISEHTAGTLTPIAQGDVEIFSVALVEHVGAEWVNPIVGDAFPIPEEGFAVVEGEAARNDHVIVCRGGEFAPAEGTGYAFDLGLLTVPPGEVACVAHTEEHRMHVLGAGRWWFRQQRETDPAGEARRAAD